jgi:CheY-like chemotaxis protein
MPLCILVVSHAQGVLHTFRYFLQGTCYEHLLFNSAPMRVQGNDLLPLDLRIASVVESFDPNLVLIDVPFGDEQAGWELIQQLRLRPATAALPLVLCITATKASHDMQSHLSAHNVYLMPKPYAADELMRVLKEALPDTHALDAPNA